MKALYQGPAVHCLPVSLSLWGGQHRGRQGLLQGTALVLAFALSGTAAGAGCIAVGADYPCTGATDQTLNAGEDANLVYSGGATGKLTVNGLGGDDKIVFGEASALSAHSGGTVADGGDGADLMTLQDASALTGAVLGGAGGDSVLIEEESVLTGAVDGGAGDDLVTLRTDSAVTGNVSGGEGADTIMLRDTSRVGGDIDAGSGADKITLKLQSTVQGNALGGAGADVVLIRGASSVQGTVDAGEDDDLVTVQEGSVVKGDVAGGSGADTLVLEGGVLEGGVTGGASTIEGDLDAGSGNDSLRLRGESIVSGDVLGGDGDDAVVVSDKVAVAGAVTGGDGDDLVTIQSESAVGGGVSGGGGADSLLVEGKATVTGAVSGDAGADVITVTSGAVRGGISGGDDNDTVSLGGGVIGALASGASLDTGAGDDALVLSFDGTLGDDALDLAAVLSLDGGTGDDTTTITGFDATASGGGLFAHRFTGWETANVAGSFLGLDAGSTITALNLTGASALFQTGGVLSLNAADGSDNATISVDATSYIDLRDAAFADLAVPAFAPFGASAPVGTADDTIRVGTLRFAGTTAPLLFPSLRVDFDADDILGQTTRDDATSGNADQIDVSTAISASGPVGIRIDASGGYNGSGMPVGLSGSVGIIDDLQADALARPGIGAALVASSTYVPVSGLPVDPGRRWALVDQGNGGVYLQWTTDIDAVTTGPHSAAGRATVNLASDVLTGILAGVNDETLAKRAVCPVATAADTGCASSAWAVWMTDSRSERSFDTGGGMAGFAQSSRSVAGGVDYAPDAAWNMGVFAAAGGADVDMGLVSGDTGVRASAARTSAGYVGAYVAGERDGLYVSGVGLVGVAKTDVVNGVLFGATSGDDSIVAMLGGMAGSRLALGGGLILDPRVEASYGMSSGETAIDSAGLPLATDAAQGRIAATVGVSYKPADRPWSLSVRAGTAFLFNETSVTLAANPLQATHGQSVDKVFTASLQASTTLGANGALSGSLAADSGANLRSVRGEIALRYRF